VAQERLPARLVLDSRKPSELTARGDQERDVAHLAGPRPAIRKIDRVLGFWPSQMNTKLTQNASDLCLGPLANELQQLCSKSASFKQQLGCNASQLEDLERQISELAMIHDDWQSFDDKLRVLEATLTQSLQDIEDIWPDLKGKAAILLKRRRVGRNGSFTGAPRLMKPSSERTLQMSKSALSVSAVPRASVFIWLIKISKRVAKDYKALEIPELFAKVGDGMKG
jgi:hypothetical protein